MVCFGAFSASAQPIMTFEKIFVKSDTVMQHSDGLVKLKFTNTGNASLSISECITESAADKCTWDKKPLAPANSAYISYKFDTKTCGRWNKAVTVKSKNGNLAVIHVKGFITCNEAISTEPENPDSQLSK